MSAEMAEGRFDYLKWFPNGARAHLFTKTPKGAAAPKTVTDYVERCWLPSKAHGVRASLLVTYRKHRRKHIKPAFGRGPLVAITTEALGKFRSLLLAPEPDGKGLSPKTVRDVIDGTLRALFRDAREVFKYRDVTGDPFVSLTWERRKIVAPDAFEPDERDILLEYFWNENRHYYPLVFTLFYTGLRTAEAVGLRRGCVDLRGGTLRVTCARSYGEDNAPKTEASARTLALRPEVVEVLRPLCPPRTAADAFVFTTQHGTPLTAERFTEKYWRRAIEKTGVRPLRFYATRHTFITLTLRDPKVTIKEVAEYCGTSVEMIEKHYAKPGLRPETVARLGGAAPVVRRLAVVA